MANAKQKKPTFQLELNLFELTLIMGVMQNPLPSEEHEQKKAREDIFNAVKRVHPSHEVR